MRFAVDAHAIGRHLTGNEVYVRNLLNGFASLDSELEFIAYLSTADAEAWVPSHFTVHRIAVIPNAAGGGLHPVRRETAVAEVRRRFEIATPFIFSVGDLQPRKNHIGLIQAFAELIGKNPKLPHQLVLAGKQTWFSGRVLEAARRSGVADRIRFLGFVSDDDLLQLYNACDLFCFPSFYEGFGLPVVEAMACGAAVACSNTSAIPEVADGAALLFNPYNADEITRAMLDLILLPDLRARMARLGLQRSMHFSWQKTAQKTLEVYCEVVRSEEHTSEL